MTADVATTVAPGRLAAERLAARHPQDVAVDDRDRRRPQPVGPAAGGDHDALVGHPPQHRLGVGGARPVAERLHRRQVQVHRRRPARWRRRAGPARPGRSRAAGGCRPGPPSSSGTASARYPVLAHGGVGLGHERGVAVVLARVLGRHGPDRRGHPDEPGVVGPHRGRVGAGAGLGAVGARGRRHVDGGHVRLLGRRGPRLVCLDRTEAGAAGLVQDLNRRAGSATSETRSRDTGGVRTYAQYCPIVRAVEVLGERWTLLIVREMFTGARRFNEMARGLPGLSRALLARRLRQLEAAGLVERADDGGYDLTRAGEDLRPLVFGLAEWGARHAFGDPRPEELDPETLMWWFHGRIDTAEVPRRAVVQVDITDSRRHLLAGHRARGRVGLPHRPGLRRRRRDAGGPGHALPGVGGRDRAAGRGAGRPMSS